MKLKVGDIVEFKKYEDMEYDEMALYPKDEFPEYGRVEKVIVIDENHIHFFIEESPYSFSYKTIVRVISDVNDVDVDSFSPGEEVWVKETVNVCYDDVIFINPVERFVDKDNVLHRTPEHPIVK